MLAGPGTVHLCHSLGPVRLSATAHPDGQIITNAVVRGDWFASLGYGPFGYWIRFQRPGGREPSFH